MKGGWSDLRLAWLLFCRGRYADCRGRIAIAASKIASDEPHKKMTLAHVRPFPLDGGKYLFNKGMMHVQIIQDRQAEYKNGRAGRKPFFYDLTIYCSDFFLDFLRPFGNDVTQ